LQKMGGGCNQLESTMLCVCVCDSLSTNAIPTYTELH
jgi:hypothetical protein